MEDIYVNRKGVSEKSFMKTIELIEIFDPLDRVYVSDNSIEKIDRRVPNHIKITGKLMNNVCDVTKVNNILGKNSLLIIDRDHISIPADNTNDDNLSFYGCSIIKDSVLTLGGRHKVGLFKMSIGEDYLKNYLLKKDYGNGFYIEYHDQPHYYRFRQSQNGKRGHLVLGRKINDEYYITAFYVPDNVAIYVPPHVLHCDGCLIGEYDVIYSKTDNYKTMILWNKNMEIVDVDVK